jgi:hypothetical protein
MTRLDALRALYEAVKAGKRDDAVFAACGISPTQECQYLAVALNPGDLRAVGAALAFIAATLPGWAWDVSDNGEAALWPRDDLPGNWPIRGIARDNPARALLLAGLAALITREERG